MTVVPLDHRLPKGPRRGVVAQADVIGTDPNVLDGQEIDTGAGQCAVITQGV